MVRLICTRPHIQHKFTHQYKTCTVLCYKISILALKTPVTAAQMLHALLKCTSALHSMCHNFLEGQMMRHADNRADLHSLRRLHLLCKQQHSVSACSHLDGFPGNNVAIGRGLDDHFKELLAQLVLHGCHQLAPHVLRFAPAPECSHKTVIQLNTS